jgi:hypothetical protein
LGCFFIFGGWFSCWLSPILLEVLLDCLCVCLVKSFGCFFNWALTLSSTSCCFVFYSFINPSGDFHVYFGLCSFVLCFDRLLASHFFVVCCLYNNAGVLKVYFNSQVGWKAIEGHGYNLQIWHILKFTLKPFLLVKKFQKQIFFLSNKCISTSRLWELPWITIIDFLRIGTMRSSSLKKSKNLIPWPIILK